jgi:predicted amidophosphoribosyltransferase
MLLDATCPVCGRRGGSPCAECRELFVPLGPVPPSPGISALYAAMAYQDAARPLVAGLKYRDQRGTVAFLADQMVAALPPGLGAEGLTWAPTTATRRRQRGFDHAELLARAVARRLGVRCRRLLARTGGGTQTGRAAVERRRDPARFRATVRRPPATVLLVDDVVTTGTTLSAAAHTLRAAGTAHVVGLVAAATPPPGGSRPLA